MSGLPKGWLNLKLGDLIELKYGKSLPAKQRSGTGYPVYGSNGVVGLHTEALVSGGGLIVGRKGSFGEVHLCEDDFSPIDTTYFVDSFPSGTMKYWYYQLKNLPLTKLNRSTAIPGLNRDDAYAQDVQLPPDSEQKRIVEKLDEVLAQVDTIKARLDGIPGLLKRFRQSVLASAVSGKLTEEWRGNNIQEKLETTDFSDYWLDKYANQGKKYTGPKIKLENQNSTALPDTWLDTHIGVVFDVHVGATPSRKEPTYWEGDIPWVSSGEVAFSLISNTTEKITQSGLSNSSTKIHPDGTVMLAMIGQGKTRGQPAILKIPAAHNQNTAALRVPKEMCVSEYLYYYLWEKYEETRRVGSGNNQKALNKSTVQGLSFPCAPIEEQKEIVRLVDQYFAFAATIEAQVKKAQARVDNLTQSILAKAFRGELVPQDPNDEPADKLLERIAEARKEAEALAKAAKKVETAKKRAAKKTAENL